jgi:sec-independent protein translocase protein TatA
MLAMIAAGIGPTEIGLILVAVLLLFGGAQLPKLAKNLGKAQKEFKEGLSASQKESEAKEAAKEAAKVDDSES